MRYIFLILILGISGAVLFGVVSPRYKNLQNIKTEVSSLNAKLASAEQLKASREDLIEKYNSISKADLDNLKVLLPDTVDNIRLIIQLDALATKNGLSSLRDVQYDTSKADQSTKESPQSAKPYGEFNVSFRTTGPYKNFLSFVTDLEQNLRLVDITDVRFNQGNATSGVDNMTYGITLKTYWLKK